mgnify:CR=1 FL=1
MTQPFFGGIHPNDKKAATNKKPIEALPPPFPRIYRKNPRRLFCRRGFYSA